jgi:hypothetical protein
VAAPEALDRPAWTVWATKEDWPMMTGEVGHPLAAGELFDLRVAGMIVGGVPGRGDTPRPQAPRREPFLRERRS